jgi:2-polyprenyl-3-methyl-5-hydroxy-6-metoxy-1,4-benzoquinol methylase
MHPDRVKWNRKYRCRSAARRGPAAEIVREFYALADRGRALDLAAGEGRNALFLAQKGFTVEALDISETGLRRIAGRHPAIRAACVATLWSSTSATSTADLFPRSLTP